MRDNCMLLMQGKEIVMNWVDESSIFEYYIEGWWSREVNRWQNAWLLCVVDAWKGSMMDPKVEDDGADTSITDKVVKRLRTRGSKESRSYIHLPTWKKQCLFANTPWGHCSLESTQLRVWHNEVRLIDGDRQLIEDHVWLWEGIMRK